MLRTIKRKSEENVFMKKIYVILMNVFLVIVITGCSNQNNMNQTPTLGPTQNTKSSEKMNNDMAIPGDAVIYLSSKEVTDQNLFITGAIKNTYENYSKSKSDELLKGLKSNRYFEIIQ